MKKIFVILFMAMSLFSAKAQQVSIVPKPQSVAMLSGNTVIVDKVNISASECLKNERDMLKSYLSEDFGISVSKSASFRINLIINKGLNRNEDSYSLIIKDGVTISSANATGIFYGIQTLRQLIKKQGDEYAVPNLAIYDYPDFQWRAFMLDEGRYFKGSKDVKHLLDEMARLKMNEFHWHLTDDQGWRIEIKKYPKLTQIGSRRDSSELNNFGTNIFDGKPHGGFYTQKEIKEIIGYASKRHINIIPEIEMPGHASAAIASYPWLSTDKKSIKVPAKFGVHYNTYNVADPKVIEFIHDVLNEVLTLFPSPVIHIGGDEVKYDHWKQSAEVKAYMEKNNIKTQAELQTFFTNNISNWLASKNRRMMGWNEITGKNFHPYQSKEDATQIGGRQLNKTSIVQYWVGDAEWLKNTLKAGYDIVNCNNGYTYLNYDFDMERAYSFNPIPDGLTKAEQKHILGLGCQMWGEFIPTEESMYKKVFPRIAACAEVGWMSYDKRDYKDFAERVKVFYDGSSQFFLK